MFRPWSYGVSLQLLLLLLEWTLGLGVKKCWPLISVYLESDLFCTFKLLFLHTALSTLIILPLPVFDPPYERLCVPNMFLLYTSETLVLEPAWLLMLMLSLLLAPELELFPTTPRDPVGFFLLCRLPIPFMLFTLFIWWRFLMCWACINSWYCWGVI